MRIVLGRPDPPLSGGLDLDPDVNLRPTLSCSVTPSWLPTYPDRWKLPLEP
jgi:hypothetical protein